MNSLQQQRLIGAVVLAILLGGIALFLLNKVSDNNPVVDVSEPELFDSVVQPLEQEVIVDTVTPVEETTVIVAEPEPVSITPVIEPDPVPVAEPIITAPPVEPISVPTPSKVEAPAPVASSAPMWLVQVGSFSVKENAQALTKQLETRGYKSITEITQSNGKTIYRVKLAPSTDKAALEKIAQQLSQELKVSPRVISHKP